MDGDRFELHQVQPDKGSKPVLPYADRQMPGESTFDFKQRMSGEPRKSRFWATVDMAEAQGATYLDLAIVATALYAQALIELQGGVA